ncbi:MAG: hypothetical protein AUG82_03990 [Ktedonobacter sp. 13_1_20CM_4_53_11]|jgi:uncharacterized membrane protein required for colicin V production|nr:MAG: hypothetical protein AUI01_08440 [Ktedonobacter sp. 13_2_20CM_2_56_8]OLE06063.1 MAG: hypothetical protein AUG82_03990 [Ktedonobacter sp. 13_1_20CM_4_53_11]
MVGSMSIVDILFLVTVILLVFSGFRNGAVISLFSLLSIPIGFFVASHYGPGFTAMLAASGLSATPLISYVVLFFGTALVLHILGSSVRNITKGIPLLGPVDTLLGGAIGFVEAWVLWLVFLIILGNFLHGIQSSLLPTASIAHGLNLQVEQYKSWHDFYNQAITNSLFAKVNAFFVSQLPALPQPPRS